MGDPAKCLGKVRVAQLFFGYVWFAIRWMPNLSVKLP